MRQNQSAVPKESVAHVIRLIFCWESNDDIFRAVRDKKLSYYLEDGVNLDIMDRHDM